MNHMHLPVISHKGSGGTSMKRQKENRIKFLETILESCLVLRQDLACPCLLSAKITGMNTPGASLSFVLSQYISMAGLELRSFCFCLPNSGIKGMCHHHAQPNL